MTNYEKIIRQARREVSRITLEQQKQLLDLYDNAIKDLSKKARRSKKDSLERRWVLDYSKELKKVRKELEKEINKQIKSSISKAAKSGVKPQQMIMNEILRLTNIDTGNHFTSMFSQVQDNVVKDIISGDLYKDNKTLSSRIWSYGEDLEKDIQYTINQAILQKKSAIELAADLEKFVKEPAKRGSTWGRTYPNLKNKKVDYNAMRLARTAINHAYQTASVKSSSMNPFVEGIMWWSAQVHGRTCQLCMDRHERIFPKDDVPLDHPNGWCAMISYIPKSLNEIADELRAWVYDEEDNPILDDWYNEYGEYFAFKGIRRYDNKGFKDVNVGRPGGQRTKNSPVNDKDIYNINKYVSSESYTINEGLRNRTGLNKEQIDTVNGLDIALSKMPNYEGDLSRSLYFMSEEEVEKFMKDYEVGAVKTFEQYFSTTKGDIYNPDGQVQCFIINSKEGKDISKYNPAEQEVLYQRGSKFRILDIVKSNDKYYIKMEEHHE